MRVKDIVVEDFCNYKVPSLFIISAECDFKCCKESGLDIDVCQNSSIATLPTKTVSDEFIYEQFIKNNITKAIVIGGLEPFLQIDEVVQLIEHFRYGHVYNAFVIYTGYYPNEIQKELDMLLRFDNIIVKFGRYIPNRPSCYDRVLGIELASNNQFALRIT